MASQKVPNVTQSDLLVISNPLTYGTGHLLLAEPSDAAIPMLYTKLIQGRYRKPFMQESGYRRSLHFSFDHIQSAMDIENPFALCLQYTKKMMGFLLFQPEPRNITLIGLGGGSLAKYCHKNLPSTDVTAVEIDPSVIALRDYFDIPPDSGRFRVVQADGLNHLTVTMAPIDVLLVDAYTEDGIADSVASQAFCFHAFRRLTSNGVLVMNLVGDLGQYKRLIRDIKRIFNQQVWTVTVRSDGNHILFAFKNAKFEPDWLALRHSARILGRTHALDFHFILQLMEHAVTKHGRASTVKSLKE